MTNRPTGPPDPNKAALRRRARALEHTYNLLERALTLASAYGLPATIHAIQEARIMAANEMTQAREMRDHYQQQEGQNDGSTLV